MVIHKLNGKVKQVSNGYHKDVKDSSYLCFDGVRSFTIPWGIRYELSNDKDAAIQAWGEIVFTTSKNIDLRQNLCDKFNKAKAWVSDDECEYLVVYEVVRDLQNGQVNPRGIGVVLSELIRKEIELHIQEVCQKTDASNVQQCATLLQQLCREKLNEISQQYFMSDYDDNQPRFVVEWSSVENKKEKSR